MPRSPAWRPNGWVRPCGANRELQIAPEIRRARHWRALGDRVARFVPGEAGGRTPDAIDYSRQGNARPFAKFRPNNIGLLTASKSPYCLPGFHCCAATTGVRQRTAQEISYCCAVANDG